MGLAARVEPCVLQVGKAITGDAEGSLGSEFVRCIF